MSISDSDLSSMDSFATFCGSTNAIEEEKKVAAEEEPIFALSRRSRTNSLASHHPHVDVRSVRPRTARSSIASHRSTASPSARVHPLSVPQSVPSSSTRRRPSALQLPLQLQQQQRPLTAPQSAVAATSVDRIKHLKTHMKQLQKLYTQELHQEELAAKDALAQTMCTTSITLFRHCASRSRFFTAVRALLCQYLPASNAQLLQIERNSEGKCFLILQNGQSMEIATENSRLMGIAGHAAFAMMTVQPHVSDDDSFPSLEPVISEAYSPSSSSLSSSYTDKEKQTNEKQEYENRSAWLETQDEYLQPSTNGHLVLLFPHAAIYHAGFHAEIDLTVKKKDADRGAYLLVMVVKNVAQNGMPLGVVEAMLTEEMAYNTEFLDAFGVLLSTALETRLTICRSVVEEMGIQVIENEDENGQQSLESLETSPDRPLMLTIPLSEDLGKIVAFESAGILPELDVDVLHAVAHSIQKICAEKRVLRQYRRMHTMSFQALQWLWGKIEDIKAHEVEEWNPFHQRTVLRDLMKTFMERVNGEIGFEIRLLFRNETIECFEQAYCQQVCGQQCENKHTNVYLSIKAQFTVLQQVLTADTSLKPDDTILVAPIGVEMITGTKNQDPVAENEAFTPRASIMVLCMDPLKMSLKESGYFSEMMKDYVFPMLLLFLEHFMWKVTQIQSAHASQRQIVNLTKKQADVSRELEEHTLLGKITKQLLKCKSIEAFVSCVNNIVDNYTDLYARMAQITLFMLQTVSEWDLERSHDIEIIWTMNENVKTNIYDNCNGEASHGEGLSQLFLQLKEPLAYTSDHHINKFTKQQQTFLSSRYSHGFFYAVPLMVRQSELIGIVEFAFDSQNQADEFIAQSWLKDGLLYILQDFLEIYRHFKCDIEVLSHQLKASDEKHAHIWKRWVDFVSEWSYLPLTEIETWQTQTTTLVRALIPTCDCVNVICPFGNDSYATLIAPDNEAVLSKRLSLLNQTVLQSCATFPLLNSVESSHDKNVLGRLILSKRDNVVFTDEEMQYGKLAASLISAHAMLLQKQMIFEEEQKRMDEIQKAAQLEQDQLVTDVWKWSRIAKQNQFLQQLSAFAYEESLESMDNSHIVEKAIQLMVEESNAGDRTQPMPRACGLLVNADAHSWTFVTNSSSEIIVFTSDLDYDGDQLWYDKHVAVTHAPPFATLPRKLSKVLEIDQQNSVIVHPMPDVGMGEYFYGLLLFIETNGAQSCYDDAFASKVITAILKLFRKREEESDLNAERNQCEHEISSLQHERHRLQRWNRLFDLARGLWAKMAETIESGCPINDAANLMQQICSRKILLLQNEAVNVVNMELIIEENLVESSPKSAVHLFLEKLDPERIELIKQGAVCDDENEESTSHEHWFAKRLLDSQSVTSTGIFYISWKPKNTDSLDENQVHEVVEELEWLGGLLQNLFHHLMYLNSKDQALGDKDHEYQQAMETIHDQTCQLNALRLTCDHWYGVHTFLRSLTALSHPTNHIDAINLKGEDAYWSDIFPIIDALTWINVTLWIIDTPSASLWTMAHGTKRIQELTKWKNRYENRMEGADVHSFPIYGESTSSKHKPRLLAVLTCESVPTDLKATTGYLSAQVEHLVAVITIFVRQRHSMKNMLLVEQEVRRTADEYHIRATLWNHHAASKCAFMDRVDNAIRNSIVTLSNHGVETFEPQSTIEKLFRAIEDTVILKPKVNGEIIPTVWQIVSIRLLLCLSSTATNGSPQLLTSCGTTCSHPPVDTVITSLLKQFGLVMDDNESVQSLELDLSRCSCPGDHCAMMMQRSLCPLISLLFPACQGKQFDDQDRIGWHLVEKASDSAETNNTTHTLVITSVNRAFENESWIQRESYGPLIMLGLFHKETQETNMWCDTMTITANRVLDACSHIYRHREWVDRYATLDHQLLSTQLSLSNSQTRQKVLHQVITQCIEGFAQSVEDNGTNHKERIATLAQNLITTLFGDSVVNVRLCVCNEDKNSQLSVIGNKHESICNGSDVLIQAAKLVYDHRHGYQQKRYKIASEKSDGDSVSRWYEVLVDALRAVVGVLVLETNIKHKDLLRKEDKVLLDAIIGTVGYALGFVNQQSALKTKSKSLLDERDRLTVEKAQLELNCLEIKHHLMQNESNVTGLRDCIENIFAPFCSHAIGFLDKLNKSKQREEVLMALGNAVTSLKNVKGVHVYEQMEHSHDHLVYDSLASAEGNHLYGSHLVRAASKKSLFKARTIRVPISNSARSEQAQHYQSKNSPSLETIIIPGCIGMPTDLEAQVQKEEHSYPLMWYLIVLFAPPMNDNTIPAYQIHQMELLSHLTRRRCHELVQEKLWTQQVERKTQDESNLQQQLTLTNQKLKRNHQALHQRTRMLYGLTQELANMFLWVEDVTFKSLSSKKLTQKWDDMTTIVFNRIQTALERSKSVTQIKLYGADRGNKWFFSVLSGKRTIQLFSSTQISQATATQELLNAYISGEIVDIQRKPADSKTHEEDEHANSSKPSTEVITASYVPISLAVDNQRSDDKIVGVMEITVRGAAIGNEEKKIIQELLRAIAPFVAWICEAVSRKQRDKETTQSTHAAVSNQPPTGVSWVGNLRLDSGRDQIQIRARDKATLKRSYEPNISSIGDAETCAHTHNSSGVVSPPLMAFHNDVHRGINGNNDDDAESIDSSRPQPVNVYAGIVPFLLKIQTVKDMAALRFVVKHEFKKIWTRQGDARKQNLGCELFHHTDDNLGAMDSASMPLWLREMLDQPNSQSHQDRILHLEEPHAQDYADIGQYRAVKLFRCDGSTSQQQVENVVAGYLLLSDSNLDKVFDHEDMQVYLPQLAQGLEQQLTRIISTVRTVHLNEQLEVDRAKTSIVATTNQRLEQEIAAKSTLIRFMTAINELNSAAAVVTYFTSHLKQFLRCDNVVFRLVSLNHKRTSLRLDESDPKTDNNDDLDATELLKMTNILKLHMFAPHEDGNGRLLGTCSVCLDSAAVCLPLDKQEYLRQLSIITGTVLWQLHVRDSLIKERDANAHIQHQLERAMAENEELKAYRHHQQQMKQTLEERMECQATLKHINTQLEAEIINLTRRLEEYEKEKAEYEVLTKQQSAQITQLEIQVDQTDKSAAKVVQLEDINDKLRSKERKLERKVLKQKLQLKQLAQQVMAMQRTEDAGKHRIGELEKHIAILTEKQPFLQQRSGLSEPPTPQVSHARYIQQLQLRQQMQKRKQLQLAQELRHLTAMEMHEMNMRTKLDPQQNSKQRLRRQQQRVAFQRDGQHKGQVEEWERLSPSIQSAWTKKANHTDAAEVSTTK